MQEESLYGDIMPETAGRALAELMGCEWPIKEPEKQGPRTSACGASQYRDIDGGPFPVMVCNAPGAPDMGYGIIEWEGNELVSYCCPLEKEDKQMDQEKTEQPALRHCDMERGDHAWAVLQEKLVVVMRVKDGYFVCGPWECGVDEDEVILLERIERPKSAKEMPLYYLDLLDVDAALARITEQH